MNEKDTKALKQEIAQWKEQRNAVILAHYYVDGDVQAIADYVGDSYYLSKLAVGLKEETIVFCGVSFMGESAKALNPGKRVVMVDAQADCPMAHMVDVEKIEQVRREHPDAAVVCYVNSTAEIKAHSDVCVTSSNAVTVVKNLPQREIFFIPDKNLAHYVADMLPEKEFIFHEGYCPIHNDIRREEVLAAREAHPGAKVLTHPECSDEVLQLSDFVGSTSQIIDYATDSGEEEFIICTETGVFYELEQKNPQKKFYPVREQQICPDMKRITLEGLRDALKSMEPEMIMPEDIMGRSKQPLEKMLELAAN